ncbi:MAG: class I SAM-dependent methyltransferase [Candidatus Micrarchaeia archaeon]
MDLNFNYSNEFKQIITQREVIKKYLVGSHVAGFDFDLWVKRRAFISDLINKSGTILDIGCANGLLLRSLQEWSKYKLIPYGIDIEIKFADQIKELFPNNFSNFIKLDVRDIDKISSFSLPDKYDFVYWHVWDEWNMSTDEQQNAVADAQEHIMDGGRLILGFYDSREKNMERIENLENVGFKFAGLLINRYGEEIAAWIDIKNQ